MLRPSRLLVLTATLTASLLAKELPRPTNPNPGLKYYYPVPKVAEPKTYDFDVVIYGASPAAVSAAYQAKKMGKSVGIFVFRRHVGGMSSSGLSDVDYGKKESIGGMAKTVFLDFFKKQVQSPAEVETLFLTMLTDLDVPVFFEHRLAQVEKQGDRLTKLVFENGNSAGPVSLDYVGGSFGWAEGSYEERERILQDHVNYRQGYLYFLANDPGIPAELRARVAQFGPPKKDFPETAG